LEHFLQPDSADRRPSECRVQRQKLSTNNSFQLYNPSYTANFAFSFQQPLLRNRGSYINKLPVTIARSKFRLRSVYASGFSDEAGIRGGIGILGGGWGA